MRFTLIPKELETAQEYRRNQAYLARMQANSRFASQKRKEQRSRNFWSLVIWTVSCTVLALIYFS